MTFARNGEQAPRGPGSAKGSGTHGAGALFSASGRTAVRRSVWFVVSAGLVLAASAADAATPAFPRSKVVESVYASGLCWRGCQSTCTWGLAACVQAAPQGVCLKETNRCDRYCQIQCRPRGGPFVPDLLEFF
jgi:hypothetical protein